MSVAVTDNRNNFCKKPFEEDSKKRNNRLNRSTHAKINVTETGIEKSARLVQAAEYWDVVADIVMAICVVYEHLFV